MPLSQDPPLRVTGHGLDLTGRNGGSTAQVHMYRERY